MNFQVIEGRYKRPPVHGEPDKGLIGLALSGEWRFKMPLPCILPGLQVTDGPIAQLLETLGFLPLVTPGYERNDVRITVGISPNNDYWSIEYSAMEIPKERP